MKICDDCISTLNGLKGPILESYNLLLEGDWSTKIFFKNCIDIKCMNNRENLDWAKNELGTR